jgi:hypothetical protein
MKPSKTFSNPDGAPRVGLVYLETVTRQLRWLNDTARQLHAEGVPVAPADLDEHPLQTPEGRPIVAAELPLVQAWRQGCTHEATFWLPRPDGRLEQVRWTAAPLFDEGGQVVVAVFGTFTVSPPEPDWQVLAGLAHDLRTPLQSMQLFLSVLDGDTSLTPQTREVAGLMRLSAERAAAIARDLLEWCRSPAQSGRRPDRTLFGLEPFLKGLVVEHTAAAQRKSLTLVSRCEAASGWEISSDRVRLGRLLSNLLSNAIRYTPHGRVEFVAQWRELAPTRGEEDPFGGAESVRTNRASLVLSVVDTGVGIAAEEQESIFHPFERGRSAGQSAGQEPESGGSGMGLSVVERLVEELGLELEVYSIFGQGSAFDLVIPPRLLHQIG